MIDKSKNLIEEFKNECVGENNTPTNDGASEAQMREGTIKYRDAFRWPEFWGTPVVHYRLSKDGVLTVVRKDSCMHANPAPDAAETVHYDEGKYSHSTWSRYESPFADLEFHTAILEDGFEYVAEGFFSGCKGLKKIILPESVKEIHPHFADNSPVEFLNEGGLLYLGTADNPHHFLVGGADDPAPRIFDEDLDEYDEYGDDEEDTHIRYIDTRGNFITEEVFDNLRSTEFQDGIAVVCKKGKYGTIDTSGEWVIEPQFDWLSSFHDGIAIAHKDGKSGHIDRSGTYVIPAVFDSAGWFCEGFAAVSRDHKWGFIDRTGQIVAEPQFEQFQDFHEGMAAVMVKGKWGFIDRTGKVVVEPIYHEVSRFNKGIARVGMWGKFGYVRTDGTFLFEPIFDSAPYEAKSVMVVRIDEGKVRRYGIIDGDGNVLLEPQSDFRIFDFHGDLARIAAKTEHGDEKWGYINIEGKVVVEPKYDQARDFSEGIGAVALGGRYGLVDRDGREIVAPKFDMIGYFHNGMADVELAKRYGYIDREGKIVIEPKFDLVGDFHRGYAKVYVGREAGVINTKGEYVVEPVYEDVNFYGDAYIRVKSDGWGVVDCNGNMVIEPQFKDISPFHDGVARVIIGPVELPSPVCDDDDGDNHVGRENKGDNNYNDLPF